jgi:hypothetical protein
MSMHSLRSLLDWRLKKRAQPIYPVDSAGDLMSIKPAEHRSWRSPREAGEMTQPRRHPTSRTHEEI